MADNLSAWVIGVLVTVLGFIGLILASGALDTMLYIFGLGLFLFAVLFVFWLVKRHYDVTLGEDSPG